MWIYCKVGRKVQTAELREMYRLEPVSNVISNDKLRQSEYKMKR